MALDPGTLCAPQFLQWYCWEPLALWPFLTMFEEPHSLPLMGLFDHQTGWTGELEPTPLKQKLSLLVEPLPGILHYIQRRCKPGAPCVQFNTATRVENYDPLAVLQHVRTLREEGLIQVIDVDVGRDGQGMAISVRGLTAEGEQVLVAHD